MLLLTSVLYKVTHDLDGEVHLIIKTFRASVTRLGENGLGVLAPHCGGLTLSHGTVGNDRRIFYDRCIGEELNETKTRLDS